MNKRTEVLTELERIAAFAVDIGAEIIRCGGEVSRAEDSVSRICRALGAKRCDVFAINSYISVCIENENGRTAMLSRRIKNRGTDLGCLEKVNQISRNICNGELNVSEAEGVLYSKDASEQRVRTYIASTIVCAVFTLYFGGGIREATVAGIAAIITVFLKRNIKNGFGNAVVFTFICSVASGTVGALLVLFNMAENYSVIAKGDIMLLVPGVSLICAGRDIIGGELLTGILGFAETLLIATALAAGFALPEVLLGGI